MAPFCDGVKEAYFLYVMPSLSILAAVVVAISCVNFALKYVRDKVIKSPRSLFVVCVAFFLVLITHFSLLSCLGIFVCLDPYLFGGPLQIALSVSSSLRLISLQQVMFYRAFLTLRGTRFAFGKCTIFMWCVTCAGFYIVVVFSKYLLYTNQVDIGLVMTNYLYAAYNVFVLWIDFSFIYKLIVVHKAVQNSKPSDTDGDYSKLLPLITKITVLTFASSITHYTSAIVGIFWHRVAAGHGYNLHLHFWYAFSAMFDSFTNFITIYLSFAPFKSLYLRLCGRCDRSCHSLCVRCTGQRTQSTHENTASSITSTNDVTSGPAHVHVTAQPQATGSVPLTVRRENEITVFHGEHSSVAVPSTHSSGSAQ